MEYSVGSLADLISGSNTPNKPKVLKKEFKQKVKKMKNDEERELQTNGKLKRKNKGERGKNEEEMNFEKPLGLKRKSCDVDLNENPSKSFKTDKKKKSIKESKVEDENPILSPTNNFLQSEEIENQVDSDKGIKKGKKKKIKKFSEETKVEDSLNDENKTNKSLNKPINEEESKREEEIALLTKEHNKRTIFVGNLPININKIKLKRMFKKFGEVESVRLRSAPIADERVPKKVAVIKKRFHKDRKSINAYVRFADRNNAVSATKLNGTEYGDHHIRVKLNDDSEKPDENKAIFLGNVSFDAEEEDLWNLFESCGAIESVRLVRDPKTDVSKGFGFVNFKSPDSVELALQMENVTLKNRELRISACENKKNKQKNKEKIKNKNNRVISKDKESKSVKDFQGKKISEKKKKKFDKGISQKKKLIKKIAPKALS